MKTFLIGLAGRSGSGKNTTADIIRKYVNQAGYAVKDLVFAAPLKKICQELFDFSDAQISDPVAKERPDARYPRGDGVFLTPRYAMQRLGTEFGRDCYPNIWVDYGMRQAQSLRIELNLNVVFTDVRFINEAKAITAAGGKVWRVRRTFSDAAPSHHLSEAEMETDGFSQYVSRHVINNGSIADLQRHVKELVVAHFGE